MESTRNLHRFLQNSSDFVKLLVTCTLYSTLYLKINFRDKKCSQIRHIREIRENFWSQKIFATYSITQGIQYVQTSCNFGGSMLTSRTEN